MAIRKPAGTIEIDPHRVSLTARLGQNEETLPRWNDMTHDAAFTEPRCTACAGILPRAGAMCQVCDGDDLFGSAPRTAPPIAGPQRADDVLHRTADQFRRAAS